MKSIMLSIRPKWVEKIIKGEKTIEVRKTRPKLETPFKCYIYCTKGKEDRYILERHENGFATRLDGKVIGYFVCDRIEIFEKSELGIKSKDFFALAESCVKVKEMREYIGENKIAYGWNISDLKIYDKPKELREFEKPYRWFNNRPVESWCDNCCKICDEKNCKYDTRITRPPQSYMYVEELE